MAVQKRGNLSTQKTKYNFTKRENWNRFEEKVEESQMVQSSDSQSMVPQF